MVFQNPSSQLFHLRVEDEVAFGLYNLGLPEDQVRSRSAAALEALSLTAIKDRRPAELSGGQKQRVAIAAALAMRPEILVLDEPTASLDVASTRQVLKALRTLNIEHGLTIIIIEHRLAEIAHLARRALILERGRIAADGDIDRVLQDRAVLRRLGLRRPAVEVLDNWECLLPSEESASANPAAEVLLEFQGLSTGYGRKPVIQDIDLLLYQGDFAALVGENGAGKSTLALAACGLLKPQKGGVLFKGGRKIIPGQDITLLFQNPCDQLFTDTVDEEVAYGPLNFDTHCHLEHEEVLHHADLFELRGCRPGLLSMGQQQRTALAACLSLRPALLILDEPTLGQDWGHLERLMDYLVRLNRQGTAILLITHDYKLVHRYARRVIWMEGGRIRRPPPQTAASPSMEVK
jgi:energy-coupling factor transport system ATP-binding protein